MPLITSTTNLKSLKYETYTQAPYVITQIPDEPESNGYQLISGLPPLGGVGGNVTDFFRGGFGLPRAIIQDEVRIGKFLLSPQGLLFTGKQELLSRIGVREQNIIGALNDGLYNPLSTLASVAGIGEGIYFNKQTQRTYTEKVKDTLGFINSMKKRFSNDAKCTQSMFDAVMSLAFNTGPNRSQSTCGGPGGPVGVANLINAGKYKEASEMLKNHSNCQSGNVRNGLIARREREYDLFIKNGYVT